MVSSVGPLLAGLTDWASGVYVAVIRVSLFLPLIFSILGLVFAFLGIKGKVKVILVLGNIVGLCLSLFLLFIIVAMQDYQP